MKFTLNLPSLVRLLGLVLGLHASLAFAQSSSPAVLGRGGDGVVVTRADLLSDAQRIPEASRGIFLTKPENLQRMAESLLMRRTLAQKAVSLQLDQDPLVQAALQQARDRVLSELYLRHLDAEALPSDEALERFARTRYQTEPKLFAAPHQTRARHILVRKDGDGAMAKAEALLQSLRQGASFEELARKESIDYASAARGGDLGFFGAGRMVKPFEDAVNALKNPGDLSGVVESQFGYHIIRLEERKEPRTLPFEEVKDRLKAEALASLQRDKRERAVTDLSATITLQEAELAAFAKELEAAASQRPTKP